MEDTTVRDCEESEHVDEKIPSNIMLSFFLILSNISNEYIKLLNNNNRKQEEEMIPEKLAAEITQAMKKTYKLPAKKRGRPRLTDEQKKEINGRREELFLKFWEKYPRKEGEVGARRWWLRISGLELIFPRIMEALEWQIAQWEGGKYAPPPVKYILDKRWNDKPVKGAKEKPKTVFGDLNFPAN